MDTTTHKEKYIVERLEEKRGWCKIQMKDVLKGDIIKLSNLNGKPIVIVEPSGERKVITEFLSFSDARYDPNQDCWVIDIDP